jgi:hypothetical protein
MVDGVRIKWEILWGKKERTLENEKIYGDVKI